MDTQRVTDIIQTIDLIAFAAAFVLTAAISWRRPRWRLPLLPVLLYTLNGTIFYMATALELTQVRMLWSAALRLQAVTSLLTALLILARELRHRP